MRTIGKAPKRKNKFNPLPAEYDRNKIWRTSKHKMGQNSSASSPREGGSLPRSEGEAVPYTRFSQDRSINSIADESVTSSIAKRGITVVNPHPHSKWKKKQPMELQKLDKVHRFWPILKSSMESVPPLEKIPDGVGYKPVTAMCQRYQEHLSEAANIVGVEQKALASRLKDLEMFSAGVAQQMMRQQERLHRAQLHLQKVDEVKTTMNKISDSLSKCVRLVRRLNAMLPEDERLEKFRLHPELDDDDSEEDEEGVTAGAASFHGVGRERALSEVLDMDDDIEVEDSLLATYPEATETTPPQVQMGGAYPVVDKVEQDWRTGSDN